MLDEFINFVQALFPSISPYIADQTKEAITQFESSGKTLNLFEDNPYEFLAQGDILNGVQFMRLNDSGDLNGYKGKGMLISNTCSADHDDEIIIAPLLEIDKLGLNKSDIIHNLHYRLLYLPDEKYKDYVIDFSLLNTFNRHYLDRMIKEDKVVKESSLNLFGFYLLICKMTVFFTRPEDKEVQEDRRNKYMKNNLE